MAIQGEPVAHNDLVAGGQTTLHSHAGGGGGPTLKSGMETAIQEGTTRAVVFATAFASVPDVVVGFADDSGEISVCKAFSPTTTGFTIGIEKSGGGAAKNRDVAWMATDTGNT